MINVSGARPEIPSHNLPLEERFAYYQSIIESNQGVFEPGTPALLGLRGLAPDNERHDSAQNFGPYNATLGEHTPFNYTLVDANQPTPQ